MRTTRRSFVLAGALVALLAAFPSPAGAQETPPLPEIPTACPESDPGYVVSKCASWTARDGSDQAFAAGVSPDGTTAYSLGSNYSTNSFSTVAYDAATGAVRWRASFTRPGGSISTQARDLAVAPDGRTVYVTGFSTGGSGFTKIATVAYDAATGAERWVRLFQSEWAHGDHGGEIVVAPDSSTVYVAGESYHVNADGSDNRGEDYRVVAYGADGTQRWTRSFDSTDHQFSTQDLVEALEISPDGAHLVVTGRWGQSNGYNYGTFSLNAATGATEWFDKYTGGASRFDQPNDIAFSPDSSRVFVTGDSFGGFGYQRATVAYNVASGARIWVARFVGQANWADFGKAVAVSPDGNTVYVTGESVGSPVPRPVATAPGVGVNADMSTQALDADTGEQIWEARYSVPRGSHAEDVVVSPDGERVYVAGESWTFTSGWNIATVAYDAAMGAELWVARYSSAQAGIGDQDDWDPSIAIAPDGGRVFVVGSAAGGTNSTKDVVTIAYDTTPGPLG